MANQTLGLDDRLYSYLRSISLREPAVFNPTAAGDGATSHG